MFGSKKSSDAPLPAKLPGRNDPCHCGSGKKYKKCHEDKDATMTHTVLEKKWQEAEKLAAKKAEEEKEAAAKSPTATTQPKPNREPSQVSGHKHNTLSVPKFNTPRRTGGG
jgi:hypothetical protein